jgi:prolyl 4-hydroxylase
MSEEELRDIVFRAFSNALRRVPSAEEIEANLEALRTTYTEDEFVGYLRTTEQGKEAARRYVVAAYKTHLQREASEWEVELYGRAIDSGRLSIAAMWDEVRSSEEAANSEGRRQAEQLPEYTQPDNWIVTNKKVEVLSRISPPAVLVKGVLNAEQCAALIAHAEQEAKFNRSMTHSADESSARTSSSAYLVRENPIVQRTMEQLCAMVGKSAETCETLQVVRYTADQQYLPHHDYFDETTACDLELGGQREYTILVYLNDDYEGGTTSFPEINLTVKGSRGDALIWRNLDVTGKGMLTTMHSGDPVLSGQKNALNCWIRQHRAY